MPTEVVVNFLSISSAVSDMRIDHLPILITLPKSNIVIGRGCLSVHEEQSSTHLPAQQSCSRHNPESVKFWEKQSRMQNFCYVSKEPQKEDEVLSTDVRLLDIQIEKPRSTRERSISQSEEGFTVEPAVSRGQMEVPRPVDSDENSSNVSQWSGFRESMVDMSSIESFSRLEKGEFALDLEPSLAEESVASVKSSSVSSTQSSEVEPANLRSGKINKSRVFRQRGSRFPPRDLQVQIVKERKAEQNEILAVKRSLEEFVCRPELLDYFGGMTSCKHCMSSECVTKAEKITQEYMDELPSCVYNEKDESLVRSLKECEVTIDQFLDGEAVEQFLTTLNDSQV